MMDTDIDCTLVRDFINDNKEIAFLYMLKQDKDDCIEHIDFIEEMQLTHKFLLYSHMRANTD
jgi:hypothetical protein